MKPYPLAPDRYLVARDGRVRSLPNKTRHYAIWLTGRTRPRGYLDYLLFIEGIRYYKQAHVMVLETYVGACPQGMQGRHLDGNPRNNNLANLRWGTAKENAYDRTKHGSQLGVNSGRCLTAESQVRRFRRWRQRGWSIKQAADKVKIPYTRAWMIDKRKNWRHLK